MCLTRYITTMNGTAAHKGNLILFSMKLSGGHRTQFPLFVTKYFEDVVLVDEIQGVLLNMEAHGMKLSPSYPVYDSNDSVRVQGLLGIDFMPLFSKFQFVPCLSGMALEVVGGVIPYRDTALFLPTEKIVARDTDHSHPNPDYVPVVPLPKADPLLLSEGAVVGSDGLNMDPPEWVDPTADLFEPWALGEYFLPEETAVETKQLPRRPRPRWRHWILDGVSGGVCK
jgi:hypothetical protein